VPIAVTRQNARMKAGAVATTAVVLAVACASRAAWWRWYPARRDARRVARDEPDLRSGAEHWLDDHQFQIFATAAVVAAAVAVAAGIAAVV
jgi:hypothetical protein